MIGIIGAMELEVEKIRSLLCGRRVHRIGGAEFCEGKLHGKDAVVAVCGMGKVNAAVCAQTMLLRFQPHMILNDGVAGGLSPDMRIGDIAVATSVVQHDMDLTPLGEPRGYIPNLGRANILCDPATVKALLAAAEKLEGVRVHSGVIATGDQFINGAAVKADLIRQFDAIACEMEGAAVGQVCALGGVPFGVIRAISDGGDDGSPADFASFARQAAERSAALLCGAFELL